MTGITKLTSIRRPSDKEVLAFRDQQIKELPNFSHTQIPSKTEHQFLEIEIGRGRKKFHSAKELIQQWRVFETPDGTPYPPPKPPEVGQTTVNLLREFGLWFLLACRITQVIDNENNYGFTFETLPGHVETGWETFQVIYDEKSKRVYYRIQSQSWHKHLLLSIGSPVVHWLQRRYKRNSAARIKSLMPQDV